MKSRSALLQKFVHMLTAFTITMKALVKLEHPEGYWPVIVFFCVSAIYIVVVTIMHDRLHRHARIIDASVYAIECMVMAVMTFLTFHEGARLLPYVYLLASIGFAISCIVRLTRAQQPGH